MCHSDTFHDLIYNAPLISSCKDEREHLWNIVHKQKALIEQLQAAAPPPPRAQPQALPERQLARQMSQASALGETDADEGGEASSTLLVPHAAQIRLEFHIACQHTLAEASTLDRTMHVYRSMCVGSFRKSSKGPKPTTLQPSNLL